MALETTMWLLDALRGSTCHHLPEWIRTKRAVRNIQNKDNRCFKWVVIAGLYEPIGNEYRVSSYTAFFMHFCPGTITIHAESINSDLQRGLDRRLRHTQH